jgi:hypothetical protein
LEEDDERARRVWRGDVITAAQIEAMLRKKTRRALHYSLLTQVLLALAILASFIFPFFLLLFYANFTPIFFAVVLDTICGFSAYIILLAGSYRKGGKSGEWWEEPKGYSRNWVKQVTK